MPHSFSFNYLILGSGIAGLSFALKAAETGSVAIITKKSRTESNTNYAQGGIACVTSIEDSFDLHVRDTLQAGAGLCKEKVVRIIVEEGPARVQELIRLGMEFSKRNLPNIGRQELDLGKEGGHSKRRVLHAKDVTGREIERALLTAIEKKSNISIFENHFAIDLITTEKLGFPEKPVRCIGVYALDQLADEVRVFSAPVTLLATGGCGKVYLYTTNPDIATGDGVAMAYRAGARIANMEFIQFHPTCLFHPKAKSFLISEAVRGEGAKLIDQQGRPFMKQYDPATELAPRDIVARAIDAEMKRSGAECVFLDLQHKGADFIRNRFPNIYQVCLKYGIDITQQPIPVVPAAHYQCGGVVTNVDGETDISGLYCVGEAGCTGLHGANRLASNSLLEALVVAHRAGIKAQEMIRQKNSWSIPPWQSGNVHEPDEFVVVSHNWDEIRRLMWDYVGIVRTTKRLQRATSRLKNLAQEIQEFYWNFRVTSDLLELRNLVVVSQLIVESAMQRKESRGLHYTLDYPSTDSQQARDTIVVRPKHYN